MRSFITKRYNRLKVVAVNRYQIVIKFQRVAIDSFTRSLSTISTYGGRLKPSIVKVSAVLLVALVVASLMKTDRETLTTTTPARTTQLSDGLKAHARQMVQDPKQYKCLSQILDKESNWSPTARNGSHYGIGQMRSTWYRDLSGNAQITETVRYIMHRYGTICDAWAFHQLRNYY